MSHGIVKSCCEGIAANQRNLYHVPLGPPANVAHLRIPTFGHPTPPPGGTAWALSLKGGMVGRFGFGCFAMVVHVIILAPLSVEQGPPHRCRRLQTSVFGRNIIRGGGGGRGGNHI